MKAFILCFLLLCVTSITFYAIFIHQIETAQDGFQVADEELFMVGDQSEIRNMRTAKKILLHTKLFDSPTWWLSELEFSPFDECQVQNCFLTANRSLISSQGGASDFDAVIFHLRNMNLTDPDLPDPRKRRRHQRYVMATMEAPQSMDKSSEFPRGTAKGFFNWSMTYRSDSDIPSPYNWVTPKDPQFDVKAIRDKLWKQFARRQMRQPSSRYHTLFSSRPNPLAWLVSHCTTRSHRERYAEQLGRHIRLDVFGSCSGLKCRGEDDCNLDFIRKEYKFVLAFENTLCKDYVTEKLFDAMEADLVPVVMGGADYQHILPPHSVINALDFASPEELAQYLREMDEKEYMSYFWWHEHYRVGGGDNRWCRLCRMLHDQQQQDKVYEDMEGWWMEKGSNCKESPFPWSEDSKYTWNVLKMRANKNMPDG